MSAPQRAPLHAGSLAHSMGPSPLIAELAAKVELVAQSDFTVIILGETGSGKELVARAVHEQSHRRKGPFVPVDCGAIPETLVESELFGHERGAFTGATSRKPGKFESARNGTLFLDEISNLTLGSQAKLLRALQEKTVWRVGGVDPFEIDVRLLVACNVPLDSPQPTHTFRRDLYYRLNEFTLRVPALRNRPTDIPYLANRILRETNSDLNGNVRGFTPDCMDALVAFEWPGNVRELRSVVRRSALLANGLITADHLDFPLRGPPPAASDGWEEQNDLEAEWEGKSLKEIVQARTAALEREVLLRTLRRTGWNKAKAARLLRIDNKTIHTKIKALDIQPEEGGRG